MKKINTENNDMFIYFDLIHNAKRTQQLLTNKKENIYSFILGVFGFVECFASWCIIWEAIDIF